MYQPTLPSGAHGDVRLSQYNWRIYTLALVISMGVLTYGYDSAFIGTTITQASFMRDFGLDKMTTAGQVAVSSNLTSICMN